MPAVAVPIAKTRPPHLKHLLPRPQIVARLECAARAGQVLLIVAPGGAGKTALTVAWATSTDFPVIWYSLDASDRDGRCLLAGIATALGRVRPESGASLLDGLADPDMPLGALVERLLDGLGEAPVTLVLDDLHHLEGAHDALHVLNLLLRLRPPTLALLLLGRVIPTLSLAVHVSTGSLAGLGWDELRLDGDEAQALLALHGLEGDGPALSARHAGWPVGILLEAKGAAGSTATAFTHLLAGLPAPLRRFALEAAVLADATAAQTDAILDRANSAACYAALAAQGLFVSVEGDTWHYHDLFAEACIVILEREDSGRLAAVVEAATAHYRAAGDTTGALALLIRHRAWAILATTLEEEAPSLLDQGLYATLVSAIDTLPSQHRTSMILSRLATARAIQGETAAAAIVLDEAEAKASTARDRALVAARRCWLAMHCCRYQETITFAEQAVPMALVADEIDTACLAIGRRGSALARLGRLDEANNAFLEALTLAEKHGLATRIRDLRSDHAMKLIEHGLLNEVETLYPEILTCEPPNAMGRITRLNLQALLEVHVGDFAVARGTLARAIAACRPLHASLYILTYSLGDADYALDLGHPREAETIALEALALARAADDIDAVTYALRILIVTRARRHDPVGAADFLTQARPLSTTAIQDAALKLTEAQGALIAGDLVVAKRALERAIPLFRDTATIQGEGRCQLLLAEIHMRQRHPGQATAAIARALSITQAAGCTGYLWPALWDAPTLRARYRQLPCLARAHRQTLAALVARLEAAQPHQPPATAGTPRLLVDPFGKGSLRLDGHSVPLTALPPRARELLFFAASTNRPLSRATILDAIWPEDPHGAAGLWDASRHLRRLLTEDAWTPQQGAYRLRLTTQDQADRFEALAALDTTRPASDRRTAADAALALYRGEYLPWCGSAWAATRRAHLGRLAAAAALALAELLSAAGDPDAALPACRRAAALDPYAEAPRALAIRALLAQGKPAAARKAYTAYAALLARDLGERPSSALADRLSHDLGSKATCSDGGQNDL